jgi:UDP-glucose 4-epimerase
MTVKGKSVLVTGAHGFIGSHLCAKLRDQGANVHGVSRAEHPAGFRRGLGGDGSTVVGDVTWWTSSLQDEEEIGGLLRSIKPDIVYHLSGCVTGSRDGAVVLPTFRSNLVSTVTLLAALQKVGCERIILAGSMEEPAPGRTDPASVSPYAASKWSSSIYGRMFYALYGLPVVIPQIFMVYGPGQRDLKKLVPYVTVSFLKNEDPQLCSGSRQVDWLYIDDAVDGFVACGGAADIAGQTLDIGSGTLMSVRGVVETLRLLTGTDASPHFGSQADRPFEIVRAADANDAFERLGWKSQVNVEEGLRRTVAWYQKRIRNGEIT